MNDHICFSGCRCGGQGTTEVFTDHDGLAAVGPDWSRLRWMSGEDMAIAMVENTPYWVSRLGAGGYSELVAIGGWDPELNACVWRQVENSAEGDTHHNFAIAGDEVQRALMDFGGEGIMPHVLWHSHEDQCGPSDVDIRSFPNWLAIGVVYCSTHRVSVAYDRDGVISTLPAAESTLSATTQ